MNKILASLKNLKHKEIILAVIAVIVMLIIYFSSFGGKKQQKQEVQSNEGYCAKMQREIENAVSGMDGVGKAEVIISWDSSVEIVPATNVTVNGNSTSQQVVNGSNGPIILKEIYPRAIGVLIVCEGGNNAKIKVDIILAISTLMDIEAEKVLVFGMRK